MIKKFIQYIMIGALVSTGGMCAFLTLLNIGVMIEKLFNRDHVIDIIGISIFILFLAALLLAIFAIIGYTTLNGINGKEKWKW